MIKINENFLRLQNNYLFADIARRINEYKSKYPKADLIRMGIGDVTQPLSSSVIKAMHSAVDEMASMTTLKGYGPEQGYDFLREAIAKNDYDPRGVALDPNEIFISDGAKSDTANIVDLFDREVKIAITDPVYPVYIDSNVIAGRTGLFSNNRWTEVVYLPCNKENNFVPELPQTPVDLIYLCYPNNPTGTTLTHEQLSKWVNYAKENKAIILFDAAYEAFISKEAKDIPHSIYEIPGAKSCAIEFRSYSKTAGFTGVRCGYTIIPKELIGYSSKGEEVPLNALWNRRQTTKFNGASYISQAAALATYTDRGKEETRATIEYYMKNASTILSTLRGLGLDVYGGVNAPYIWLHTPQGMSSWDFFDYLLQEKQIVGTPGIGFGPEGEGYFRLSAFGTHQATQMAMERLSNP